MAAKRRKGACVSIVGLGRGGGLTAALGGEARDDLPEGESLGGFRYGFVRMGADPRLACAPRAWSGGQSAATGRRRDESTALLRLFSAIDFGLVAERAKRFGTAVALERRIDRRQERGDEMGTLIVAHEALMSGGRRP